MTQEAIASWVGVSPKTLSEWVNEKNGAWKIARAARSITKDNIISSWYSQLYELNESINSRPDGQKFPTSTEADTQSKISANIERLDRKNSLAFYMQVMDEFMEFLTKREPKLGQQLAMQCLEFVKHKSSKLNGN